jgi:hypothetical protein
MTEEEAKMKWCPMVRYADCGANNASAVNRDGTWETNIIDRCIASDCMMWRWDDNYPDGHCGLVK